MKSCRFCTTERLAPNVEDWVRRVVVALVSFSMTALISSSVWKLPVVAVRPRPSASNFTPWMSRAEVFFSLKLT